MVDSTSQPIFCYVHPQRQTLLRCNNCDRPICTSCAVLTPTGYRCKECVKGQQKIFDTTRWWDYPVTLLVTGVISYLGSLVAGSFGFFTLLLAPGAGMIIAEVVRFAVRRRRSKQLLVVATVGTVIGGLIVPVGSLLAVSLLTGSVGRGVNGLLWPVVYAGLAAGTVHSRLKGIRI